MTGLQAIQILQKPVFGDERCIEARDVYALVLRLQSLRKEWAHEDMLEEIYSESPAPWPKELTQTQLENEIAYWEGFEDLES